jgi:hypothetical protein
MLWAIDQKVLEGEHAPKVMDINKPPLINIPHEKFPKAIYLHPKDKQKEHLAKIVKNEDELKTALRQGWKTAPHVPIDPPAPELESGEYETVR